PSSFGSHIQSALLKTLSPSSACIGESLSGKGRLSPEAVSNAAGSRCTGTEVSSSTVTPESTDRFCAVRSTLAAKRSLCLIRSQFLASLVRTSAKDPLTFSPRSRKLSLPLSRPSRTRRSASLRSWNQYSCPSSGEYTPQSQTMTSPAPYCPGGITPSNEP